MIDNTFSPDEFDEAVIEYLESTGHPKISTMAREHSNNSRAFGPSDVAREEGLDLDESTIAEVAEAHKEWYTISHQAVQQ